MKMKIMQLMKNLIILNKIKNQKNLRFSKMNKKFTKKVKLKMMIKILKKIIILIM